MSDEDLARRLGKIERRLRRVENSLGLVPKKRLRPPPPIPAVQPERSPARPSWADKLQTVTEDRSPPIAAVAPAVMAVAYAAAPRPMPPLPQPAKRASLEQAIGLKAAGWAGAIAVVAAVAWAVQWAYANGYFAAVTPAVRVTLLAAAGAGLIAAGEWVFRRVNPLSATGLFGAGVAVLFVAGYAGHAYYNLYGQNAAFALTAAATLVGAAVARRGNLVSVAVLSIVGATLAPWLLGNGTPSVVGFLGYLFALQVVAVGLAYAGGEPKWWVLRGLSLVTTAGWAAAVVPTPAFAGSPLTPAFLLAAAALFQIELIASAVAAPIERNRRTDPEWGGAALFSLAVTAGLVIGLVAVSATAGGRLAWVLGTAAVTAVAAVGGTRSGRAWPVRILGIGFAAQAAALLVVAVPVAVGGVWIAVGWAGLAVAYAVVGRAAKAPVAAAAGAAIWTLAVGDLVLWTTGPLGQSHVGEVAFSVLGTTVPTYAVAAAVLSFVGHVIARLAPPARQPVGAMLSAAAAGVFGVAVLAAFEPGSATVAVLAYVWLTAVAGWVGGGAWLVPQAVAVLAVAAGKWASVDALIEHRVPSGPIDPAAVIGVGLAGTVAVAYTVRRRWSTAVGPAADGLFAAAGLVIAGLLAWAASVEVGPATTAFVPVASASAYAEWTFSGGVLAWAAAVAGYLAVTTRLTRGDDRRRTVATSAVAAVPALLAVVYVGLDDVLVGLGGGGSRVPVVSPRGVAAAAVLAVLVLQRALAGRLIAASAWVRRLPVAAAVGLALVAGSFEVDRAFSWAGSSALSEEVGLSVFWATFAVAAIAAGFGLRTPGLRYFGLTLFAVTLVKVLVVDESRIGSGGRVLSFLGVGLLLLGTSVLYGRVAGKEEAMRTSNTER